MYINQQIEIIIEDIENKKKHQQLLKMNLKYKQNLKL